MFECSDLLGRSSYLNTNLDNSLTWRSPGTLEGLNDGLYPTSSSSTDYGDYLSASNFTDAIDNSYSLSATEMSPLVASDPGSVFNAAYNIGNLSRPQTFTDFVGINDTSDIYSFNLSSYSSFNLSLNGLTSDANVDLYDVNGTRLTFSALSGTNTECIDGSLQAGTYYVRVYQNIGNTNYRLGLSATPIVNNTRTVLGTLDANQFTFQSGFSRTVISGNGNVDFSSGRRDLLDLSSIYSNTVTFSNASGGGGLLYNPGNGTRLFDTITFSSGSQILFEGIDSVQFADKTLNLSVIPNDPLFGQQWNLHMMGVQNVWRFTTGSNKILVGIEDTGLASDRAGSIHSDLGNTTIYTDNYKDESYVSHGTGVQGIIAALSNNGSGMSGINWNSPVFNIDVLGGDTNDRSLTEATGNLINKANQNGQRLIINLSLEHPNSPEFNQLVANNPNVLFVIASGNDADSGVTSLTYPAILAGQYNNVIAVGASWGTSDRNGVAKTPGERIQYNVVQDGWGSQYGSGLTLMGPSEVVSTRAISPTGTVQFDYYTGSGDRFNGTSAATPNVTGVASLVWSANPNLSATQVKQILSQTAYDLGVSGYDIEYGSGFINADAAVRRALALAQGVA
ncbi:S8 family serine peptidase [Scytonema sp. NUACC26]|uniref:S8 family serine peptidase n=1 Tax=Scytonema sp. NUACC26 TaxID=3140176 RepID=UPI0034DCBFC3